MRLIKNNVNVSTLLLLGVLIAVISYQVGAERPTTIAAQPTTVAVVDLMRVLDGLAQRSEADASLNAMGMEFQEERGQREAELERLQTEFEQLSEQSIDNADLVADAVAAEEQLALETLRYQAWMQFTAEQLDIEQGLLLQDLYRAIKREAESMAAAQGYNLVVVDDSKGELGINPEARASRAAQIEQQIMSRLMLYSDESIDITDDLIERMNNAYRAGR